MNKSILLNLKLSEEQFRKFLPSFSDRQSAALNIWQESLGLNSLTAKLIFEKTDLDSINKENSIRAVGLPDSIKIGKLNLKEEYLDKSLSESAIFLKEFDMPAVLNFKEKSAILNCTAIDSKRMSKLIQIAFIKLFMQLDSKVINCTVIDLKNFGDTFPLLTASIPNLEIISDSREVDQYFRKLSDLLKTRNKKRGFAYPFIYDYNEKNEDAAEPYHFIFISAYDLDLREEEKSLMGRLLSGENAAKAGIYFIINFDSASSFKSFSEDYPSLPKISESLKNGKSSYIIINDPAGLDNSDLGIHKILNIEEGNNNLGFITKLTSSCMEHLLNKVPSSIKFSLPNLDNWKTLAWQNSASKGLTVPIGKSQGSATYLRLGEDGMVHNALVGGAVGTGKTNLLHAIILQSLANYSPEELRLSLLDYKSGTEFKEYQNIPHLYAISLGSKIKFGIDLLVHFKNELERRADLFKRASVKDLNSYKEKTNEILPRHLIIIDEFQVLFTSNQQAKNLIEDLIRRGRSFGFNFILSTQSLKDASLSSPTKSNIGARICLKLSESDCWEFLSTENIAPSRFDFKGQAIYNDKEGRSNGNVEFRVAYYSDIVIKEFLATLDKSHIDNNSKVLGSPFKYIEDGVTIKNNLLINNQGNDLFIGYIEGIPIQNLFININASLGPVVCVGTGPSRVLFEINLFDEFNKIAPSKYMVIDANDLEGFLIKFNEEEYAELKYVVTRVQAREAVNSNVQNLLPKLINNSKFKLIIFIENSKIIIEQLYSCNIKKNTCDKFICFDSKSVQAFYGQVPQDINFDDSYTLYDESDNLYPTLVKIPMVIKGE